jgi:hypothetical protein
MVKCTLVLKHLTVTQIKFATLTDTYESVVVWEAMHVITGADTPEPQKANAEFIWRKHV